MKTCENCSSLHNGEYASGRFCSSKCSKSFSTKNKRKEINEKLSLIMLKAPIKKQCPFCKKYFLTKRREKKFCGRSCQGKHIWTVPVNRSIFVESCRKSAIKRHENGDLTIGWKTRKNREPSYPEKTFIFLLDEMKILYEREFKIGKYFVDFVFHSKKIALEIDGRRHDDEDIKLKDQEKEKMLTELGWKIFRIKWKKADEARIQLEIFLKNAELV